MPGFRYDEAITARFPRVVGGVIHAVGVRNGPAPAALETAFREEQSAVRARLGGMPLSELPTLAAWRSVFRAFGVDPTQYRSAAEALLRRLVKQGELPTISSLVDLANLVSIRHALPVAVFDSRSVIGDITVRFARGDEPWADLGASETDRPEDGEVIFVDAVDVVSARRWCWRQSRASATREDTAEILVTVEGHHAGAAADIAAALGDLETLLGRHASPESLRIGTVDATHPSFGGR
jgi:DNA/RNA-binding domain of Phe-tRNA-synthetase-like protein